MPAEEEVVAKDAEGDKDAGGKEAGKGNFLLLKDKEDAPGQKCSGSTPLDQGQCCDKASKQIVNGATKMSNRWCKNAGGDKKKGKEPKVEVVEVDNKEAPKQPDSDGGWWKSVESTFRDVFWKKEPGSKCVQWWCRKDVQCRVELVAEKGLEPELVKKLEALELPDTAFEKVEENLKNNGDFKLEQFGEDPEVKDDALKGVEGSDGAKKKMARELTDISN